MQNFARISSLTIFPTQDGVADIKSHDWFEGLDFEELRARKPTAPWIPPIKGDTDTSNFEDPEEFEDDDPEWDEYEDDGSGWDDSF
jgi:serum/glucocorticoid-regulated kinase 2